MPLPQTVEFITGVQNPVLGQTAISDSDGLPLTIMGIIRYNGNGNFTCSVTRGFVRISQAEQINENGLLVPVAPGVPRFNHHIAGVLQPLLLESFAQNVAQFSFDLTQNSVWIPSGTGTTLQTAIGLRGTPNTATIIADTDNAGSVFQVSQTVPIPNDSATHTVDFWIRKDLIENRFPEFFVGCTFSGPRRTVQLNTKTGATIVPAGGGTSGVSSHRVIDMGFWWLLEITVTNNSTGKTSLVFLVEPAATTTFGILEFFAIGSIIVGQVDAVLNTNSYSTPILTLNGAVLRTDEFFDTTKLSGIVDVYFDTIWKAKPYVPLRYRDEEGVEKNM